MVLQRGRHRTTNGGGITGGAVRDIIQGKVLPLLDVPSVAAFAATCVSFQDLALGDWANVYIWRWPDLRLKFRNSLSRIRCVAVAAAGL